MKGKPGKCAVCGKFFEHLSFEHIPPHATGNSGKALTLDLERILSDDYDFDSNGMKGKQSQGGAGEYSLCREHNSFFGKKYVPQYLDFVSSVSNLIRKTDKDDGYSKKLYSFETLINPLLVSKQIVAMFLSLNYKNGGRSGSDFQKMSQEYLLDVDSREFPTDRFEIRMNLYLPSDYNDGIRSYQKKFLTNLDLTDNYEKPLKRAIVYSEIQDFPVGFTLIDKRYSTTIPKGGLSLNELLTALNQEQKIVMFNVPIIRGIEQTELPLAPSLFSSREV